MRLRAEDKEQELVCAGVLRKKEQGTECVAHQEQRGRIDLRLRVSPFLTTMSKDRGLR